MPTASRLAKRARARAIVMLGIAVAVGACAHEPPKRLPPGRKLKLETIDHGPMRPKTYVYREVNDPASR